MTTIIEKIWDQKVKFFTTFFVVFTLMYAILFVLDFLPEPPKDDSSSESFGSADSAPVAIAAVETSTATVSNDGEAGGESTLETQETNDGLRDGVAYLPTSITIPKLDKSITVLNPQSRTVEDLDAALLEGVVRHPDSALLNQTGNVFILGHSSYLPNVINRNFQAFNGIQNLEWGDTIEVTSGEMVFVYRVDKVYRAKASDITVPIAGDKHKLTLATCNSFGTIDDRYIVEAYFVSTKNT